jgi:hypothetical protein
VATSDSLITYLDCVCGGGQPHRLTYVHDRLLTITCERCGRTTKMPKDLVLGQYTRDFRGRLGRLPAKVLNGVAHQPVRFVLTLPVKAASKVGQVLQEIRQISRS